MILGFAHPGIVVPDLEAARRFYEEMFGFRMVGEEAWEDDDAMDRGIGLHGSSARGLMLAGRGDFLELFEYLAPVVAPADPPAPAAHEPGIRHLAFFVDDCRAELRRLLDLGGRALGEPVDVGGGSLAVYARDPFGNIIELCEATSAADVDAIRIRQLKQSD